MAVLLSIIMTMVFTTSVYYGAIDDTVLFEDFGTNFSVDYSKGEISLKKSGITYTTGSGAFPDGKTVVSVKDGALYVKARQSDVSGADVNMNFDEATGRVYLAFDFRVCGWGTYNFMSGQDILRIGDENGNNVASLFIDCTSSSGNAAYWVKTKSSQSHIEDSYTVGKLMKNGKGYSSFVRVEYIIDIENRTYTVIFDQNAKTFDFDSDSINSVSCITLPNNHQTAQWFNKDYMIDNVTVKINTGSLIKTVNFYENEKLIK